MRILAQPRDLAELTEIDPVVPEGAGDRFCGYGVMGLPFRSGHLLALRRFPASSLGYGYSSVWHRDPEGGWTFWSDNAPEASCARFFGSAAERIAVRPIRLRWTGPSAFRVTIEGELDWSVDLRVTPATLVMNTLAACLPQSAFRRPAVLRHVGRLAGPLLGAGVVNLTGRAPNGHRFSAMPLKAWIVKGSEASVEGTSLGPIGPLSAQAFLADFALPQRGIFMIGGGFFRSADPAPVPHQRSVERPAALGGVTGSR